MSHDLFVSPVVGRPTSRFGTATKTTNNHIIGGHRKQGPPGSGRPIEIDEAQIVMIPSVEYVANKREYDRAIQEGSLRKRTKKEYEAFICPPAPIPPPPPPAPAPVVEPEDDTV